MIFHREQNWKGNAGFAEIMLGFKRFCDFAGQCSYVSHLLLRGSRSRYLKNAISAGSCEQQIHHSHGSIDCSHQQVCLWKGTISMPLSYFMDALCRDGKVSTAVV